MTYKENNENRERKTANMYHQVEKEKQEFEEANAKCGITTITTTEKQHFAPKKQNNGRPKEKEGKQRSQRCHTSPDNNGVEYRTQTNCVCVPSVSMGDANWT